MKALIWKEARQQLVWFLVALSLATQLWFGMGDVWKQLVLPPGENPLVFLLWPLVYAAALAQLQFGRAADGTLPGPPVDRCRLGRPRQHPDGTARPVARPQPAARRARPRPGPSRPPSRRLCDRALRARAAFDRFLACDSRIELAGYA